jgi:hypothetical protein
MTAISRYRLNLNGKEPHSEKKFKSTHLHRVDLLLM